MKINLKSVLPFIFLVCLFFQGKLFAQGNRLLAGTAKVNITPLKMDEPLHDSVYARSLVLDLNGQRLAFVSVDLVIFTSERIEQVCKQKFGIAHVMICSSHDHSGPLVDNKINFQNNPYTPYYEDQIISAIGQSVKQMFPARITAGQKTFPQLGFNRLIVRDDGHARESWIPDAHYKKENPERIPFGPVDPEVGVIRIDDMKGNPRVVLMNYACHADIVCFNYAVSADYPGVACKKVEDAFDNKVNCLFIQGAAGNVESLLISPRRSGPTDTVKTDYAPMQRTGELLAYETVKLARSLSPGSDTTNIKCLSDSLHFTGRYDKSISYNVKLLTIIINNKIVLGVSPGEYFAQLGLEWKAKMREAAVMPFFFGYAWSGGSWPGYIADVRSAALGGYGADNGGRLIQIGAGEAIITRQLENYYRLTGIMRTKE